MVSTRINQLSKAQLFDPSEALKIRVIDDVENQFASDCDKSVNRIIDYLFFVQSLCVNSFKFGLVAKAKLCKDIIFYGRTMR